MHTDTSLPDATYLPALKLVIDLETAGTSE